MTNPPILVLGATGKTGRRVADRLASRGLPVRSGSRTAEPAFDWADRDSWAPALDGVRAVYVTFFPDLAVPGAADTVGAFAERAAAAGLERLVLLSGRGEPEAQRTEALVRAAFPRATVVRCSFFAQNFSEGAWREDVLAGRLALPVGDVREPFLDADDIADVAVAALTEGGHAGELYELTGPAALTFAEAAAELTAATGREVRFEHVPLAAWTAALAEQGVPAEVVELLASLFTEILDGRNAQPTDGVRRALGRAPRTLGDALRMAVADGAFAAVSA